MFSLICAWTNSWVNNCEARDLRHHPAHCDISVMNAQTSCVAKPSASRGECQGYLIPLEYPSHQTGTAVYHVNAEEGYSHTSSQHNNFLQNMSKRASITYPWGWGMECPLWVHILIYIPLLSLSRYMYYPTIITCYKEFSQFNSSSPG